MGVSKATTKKEALKEYKGYKKFTILVDSKFFTTFILF